MLRTLVVVEFSLFATASLSSANPLEGTWKSSKELTIQRLEADKLSPDRNLQHAVHPLVDRVDVVGQIVPVVELVELVAPGVAMTSQAAF